MGRLDRQVASGARGWEQRPHDYSAGRAEVDTVPDPTAPPSVLARAENVYRVKRRDFLLLATGTAIAWHPALAAPRAPRIGFIGAGSGVANQSFLDGLRDGLRALDWTDGGNLVILNRGADGHTERLPAIARELIASAVDILVTAGTAATLAATSATTTIPIVMVGVGDPVALGVVDSLAQPGGNATGLSSSSIELIAKRLELLQELIPSLGRVAIIVRNDPDLEQKLLDIRNVAEQMGLEVVELEARSGRDLEFAFTRLRNDHCDAIYVASGPLGPAKRAQIIALAEDAQLPVIYSFGIFAVAGGLISFATDDNDLFRRAATFVDRILRGVNPADMPVEQPTKFELVINLKTARALKLPVPPSLLARADAVLQ
jgi:putative ABC transport system substrate-binding protein